MLCIGVYGHVAVYKQMPACTMKWGSVWKQSSDVALFMILKYLCKVRLTVFSTYSYSPAGLQG